MRNGFLARTVQLRPVDSHVDYANAKKVSSTTKIIVYKIVDLKNVKRMRNFWNVLIVRIAALIIHVQHVIKKAAMLAVFVNNHMSEIH